MAANSLLQSEKTNGLWAGFRNMFAKENSSWWRTRQWLVQSLIWLVVLNGLLASVMRVPPQTAEKMRQDLQTSAEMTATAQITGNSLVGQGLMVFLLFAGLALPVVAIILGDETVIGEKQPGTAAWVLSKPVGRKAFILSKLLANALGLLTTCVVLQGAVAYLQISLKAGALFPLLQFCGAMGLVCLNILFYLTLAVMLSTLFRSRGPVLGISLAVGLGGASLISMVPKFIVNLLPWSLLLPNGGASSSLALYLALGEPLPTIVPIISTAVLCLVFTAVALWRFDHEEF